MLSGPSLRGRLNALVGALLGLAVVFGSNAQAHNLSYALATVEVSAQRNVRIELRCHLPALVMGVQQGGLTDAMLPRFLALSDAEIARREGLASRTFLSTFSLRADGRLIDAVSVAFPSPAALRVDALTPNSSPKPSPPLVLSASLPDGVSAIDLALPPDLGPAVVLVKYPDGRTSTEALTDGERTHAIHLAGPSPWRDGLDALARFTALGFEHILPRGLDHILFIVALAVGAPRLGQLIRLATTFTLAHSITLALAAFRIVQAPPAVVEPAISLSIAAVGLMTLLLADKGGRERIGVVFLFGLLHGLGFASALRASGLPRGQEALALAGFNIGVELGQITVILAVLAVVGWWRGQAFYRARIAMPVSAAVVAVGLLWTTQRIIEAIAPTRFGGL